MSYATRKTPRSSFFGDVPPVNVKVSPIYVKSPPIIAESPPLTTGVISSSPMAPSESRVWPSWVLEHAPGLTEIPNVVWWGVAAATAYYLFGRS